MFNTQLVTLFLCLGSMASIASAEELDLKTYLRQVEESHQGLIGEVMIRNGSELRSSDAQLAVSPTLFASVTLLHDSRTDPLFRTDEQTRNNYTLGISQLTTFGLQAKLAYTFDYSHYDFLPSTGTAPMVLNQGKPSIELTQSLWRNAFGTETKAQIDYSEASALSTSHSASYQTRVILSQAESAYWALSLTRSAVKVTADVLDRAQKLYNWNEKRVNLRLADPSDLLQAEALLKLRKLDYQQAQDNDRVASRNLNEFRGRDTETVAEDLTALAPPLTAGLQTPQRAALREDVQAAREQVRASVASAKVANEKDKPNFEIFGTASLNGSDQYFAPTLSNSFKTDQPTLQGGVRLVMPLSFGIMSDAHKGYALEEQGAERQYQRKFFEQETQWADLNQRLADAKTRYELYRSLEAAQKRKLEVERERLNRGKTTTFNVIQFEQDAAQSELGTLRAQADILQLIAQMKTFGGPL